MSKTHLVFSCAHAHWEFSNERADWLSRLIIDVRPDVVVNLGDNLDLPSLYQASQGKKPVGQSYKKDIDSHIDFQQRLWEPIKTRKKRLPYRVCLHGNHEQRIKNTLSYQPELDGAVSFGDLRLSDWYDEIVPYEGNTPGTIEIDGITYAHYIISGVSGRPLSSEHQAHSLLSKTFQSVTVGHTHTFDYCVRTRPNGTKIMGAVVGCYSDYTNDWAGEIGKLWDRGVLIKRNVDKGEYDHEWISLKTIKNEYEY